MNLSSTTLTMMMALAAWLFGISLFVQVVQELYKFLTSSKSRAYTNALVDFAGPFARQLLEPSVAPELTVRSPFQFRRLRPQGKLLPLEKHSLIDALERTAPMWHRLTRQALVLETKLQCGRPQNPSSDFTTFLASLDEGTRQAPGNFDAVEMLKFIEGHGVTLTSQNQVFPSQSRESGSEGFDAARALLEFRARYSSQIVRVEENFGQFMANFEYSYRRRNLRQTFVLALLLALWFDFSFDSLYRRAASASLTEARAAAEQTVSTAIRYLPQPRLFESLRSVSGFTYYLTGCLLTAVLVCFGAPFWNDLTKSLLRVSQADGRAIKEPEDREFYG